MFYTKTFMDLTCSLKRAGYWPPRSLRVYGPLRRLVSSDIYFQHVFTYLSFTPNFVLVLKRSIFTKFAFPEAVACKRECLAPHSRCVIRHGTEERCECIAECPKEIKHVCGSDKVTYNNTCLLEKAACENNKVITVFKTGRCQGMFLDRDCN